MIELIIIFVILVLYISGLILALYVRKTIPDITPLEDFLLKKNLMEKFVNDFNLYNKGQNLVFFFEENRNNQNVLLEFPKHYQMPGQFWKEYHGQYKNYINENSGIYHPTRKNS